MFYKWIMAFLFCPISVAHADDASVLAKSVERSELSPLVVATSARSVGVTRLLAELT